MLLHLLIWNWDVLIHCSSTFAAMDPPTETHAPAEHARPSKGNLAPLQALVDDSVSSALGAAIQAITLTKPQDRRSYSIDCSKHSFTLLHPSWSPSSSPLLGSSCEPSPKTTSPRKSPRFNPATHAILAAAENPWANGRASKRKERASRESSEVH